MKNWNRPKLKRFAVLGVLGLMMVLKFQNCAPVSNASSSGAASGSASLPVTDIDNVKVNPGLTFSYPEIEFQSSVESVLLSGTCPTTQEGAVFAWSMTLSGATTSIASGSATCHDGAFDVELDQLSQMQCGQTYVVSTRLGVVQGGTEMVKRLCP
jgi:hypothetical protein